MREGEDFLQAKIIMVLGWRHIPKTIMRKFKENYAVKLSVKCRQTFCARKTPLVRGG